MKEIDALKAFTQRCKGAKKKFGFEGNRFIKDIHAKEQWGDEVIRV
ncbi:MAG: hypothetical protein ABIN94_22970 [Ferruginibacter sp.]